MRYSTIVEKDDKTLLEIIDAEEIPYIQGCDTLVVNALRQQPHHSHQTLDEAVAFARRIAPRQTWLIHSSHDIGRHAEVNAQLPPPTSSWPTMVRRLRYKKK